MSCEESHGFFQFTDDCFRDEFLDTVKRQAHKPHFTPIPVHDQWFATAEPVAGFDQITLSSYNVDYLYAKRRYRECIDVVKTTLSLMDKHNHVEREMVETMARCAVKLNDRDTAMMALNILNEHHQVEEPGLSALKCKTYFHFGEFDKGYPFGVEYLRLRPSDFLMHIYIAEQYQNVDRDISNDHFGQAKQILSSYRRSERELADQYLFAQVYEDFRLPELESVLECVGLCASSVILYDTAPPSKTSPFCIIVLPDDKAALQLLSRTVLLMDVYRLFATADSFDGLVESSKSADYTPYHDKPFKFRIDSFMKTYGEEEQVDMINRFSWMPLRGPVRLKDASATCFAVMNDHVMGKWWFGVLVRGPGRQSMREQVDRYSLKKRDYLGTTSMDAEIGFIMANVGRCAEGDLVYDPFVGTGSLLIAAAHFGAFAVGSDIDGRQMRGGRKDDNGRGSLHTNTSQYGIDDRVLGGLVFDICQPPWRDGLQFDAIICDPPYGVRAGAKRIAKVADRQVPQEMYHILYPQTAPYELDDLTGDLLQFAATRLRVGGRLVFWYAQDVKGRVFDPSPQFQHPHLLFKYSIPQPMRMICRWLLVYERIQ